MSFNMKFIIISLLAIRADIVRHFVLGNDFN